MYFRNNFCCIGITDNKGYYADLSMHSFEMPVSMAKYLIGRLNKCSLKYVYNLIDHAEKFCMK